MLLTFRNGETRIAGPIPRRIHQEGVVKCLTVVSLTIHLLAQRDGFRPPVGKPALSLAAVLPER